jgi:hypothetical protein
MGGNIVCTYDEGDRMLSKTMKIAEQADFLTIEVPNPSPGAALIKSQENWPSTVKKAKLIMAGEEGISLP